MSASTVLIVEDDPDDLELILRSLKRANFANSIEVVRDGAAAVEWLLENGPDGNHRELPAVVLLDLKLPKIDGLGVLKRLRQNERTKVLPIVILTSSDERVDIDGSYANGANSYVRKPIVFNEFATAIANLGLYWLVLNQPP